MTYADGALPTAETRQQRLERILAGVPAVKRAARYFDAAAEREAERLAWAVAELPWVLPSTR